MAMAHHYGKHAARDVEHSGHKRLRGWEEEGERTASRSRHRDREYDRDQDGSREVPYSRRSKADRDPGGGGEVPSSRRGKADEYTERNGRASAADRSAEREEPRWHAEDGPRSSRRQRDERESTPSYKGSERNGRGDGYGRNGTSRARVSSEDDDQTHEQHAGRRHREEDKRYERGGHHEVRREEERYTGRDRGRRDAGNRAEFQGEDAEPRESPDQNRYGGAREESRQREASPSAVGWRGDRGHERDRDEVRVRGDAPGVYDTHHSGGGSRSQSPAHSDSLSFGTSSSADS
jgi:hypothetical protein